MPSPRVVHLVYDLIRGGTEGQCARVAMGLARRGLSHRVAVFHRHGFFLEGVEAVCGPVHEVAIRHLARVSTLLEIFRLARWLRREQIDILHTWDADAAIFGQVAARLAGVKLVTSRRDLGQIYPRWKLALMRRADRQAMRVVANAEAIRDYFTRQGVPGDKIEVIPNLLDLAEFDAEAAKPFPQAARLPEGRRLVVVNRLDPEKNTGLLIEALPMVRRQVPDAVLVVAGDGPEMPMLQNMAQALGVRDAVGFLGVVHDVPALLTCCEAGALVPSRNEGLSNTILEYMAAGLPVLATDCGGNRELVHHGVTGWLIPIAGAGDAIVQGWIHLMRDPNRRVDMGRHGRNEVVRQYAGQAGLDRLHDFYSEVAASD